MTTSKSRALNQAEKASVLSDVNGNKHKKDCWQARLCHFLKGPVQPATDNALSEAENVSNNFIEALANVDGASDLIGAKVAVRASSLHETIIASAN